MTISSPRGHQTIVSQRARCCSDTELTRHLTSRGSAARPVQTTARIARDHDSNPRLQQPLVRLLSPNAHRDSA
jgi:hypothetical protein